jgi:putative Mn2+ efflux pump MntP
MKTFLITAVWGAFLFWIYSYSHAGAILIGVIGLVLMMASVRRDVRRQQRRP